MSIFNDVAAPKWSKPVQTGNFEAMGAAERQRWAAIMLAEEIQDLVRQLSVAGLLGVAITGAAGTGKSSLANSVAKELGATHQVLNLFVNPTLRDEPFSTFIVQLARITENEWAPPEKVVDALVELIASDAHGAGTLIVLEGLPGLDTWSTAVLMRLLLRGGVKLLVTAKTAAELPVDLVSLLRDRLLAQHRLEPLDWARCETLLEGALMAPVSASAVSVLHGMSAGNPMVLQGLVQDFSEQGIFRSQDGIWVLLAPPKLRADGFLGKWVGSRMSRESGDIRRGLEIAALMQDVSLPTAISVLGTDVMSALEEAEFLTVARDGRELVTFVEPYLGLAIRSILSSEQMLGHLGDLAHTAIQDPELRAGADDFFLAQWRQSAMLPIDPDMAHAAALIALERYEPEMALSLCPPNSFEPVFAVRVAQVRSRAHYLLSDFTRAIEELEAVPPYLVEQLDAVSYASWITDWARSLMWLPEGHARAAEALKHAGEHIKRLDADGFEPAKRQLILAVYENEVHEGNFTEVSGELEREWAEGFDREFALNCACLLSMVMAATGRQIDAIQLSEDVEKEARKLNVGLRMGGWHVRGRILALGWSGQWRSCEDELAKLENRADGMVRIFGSVMELALGIAYLSAQQSELAVAILRKAAAQMEIRNSGNSRVLIYSTLAFAYADLDDLGQSRRFLSLAQAEKDRTDWASRSLAEFFRLQTLVKEEGPTGVSMLSQMAEDEMRAGRPTIAAACAHAAAMSTRKPEGFGLLARAAQKNQGPLAHIRLLLAQANCSLDANLALEAAQAAHQLELTAVELLCAKHALSFARAKGQKQLARSAQQRLQALAPKHRQIRGLPTGILTPREMQVADMAQRKLSNRQIAAQLEVSIRTVEGHLYQIFAKLNIASRDDLETKDHL